MLHIAICENERMESSEILTYVYEWEKYRNYAVRVSKFKCGKTLLADSHKTARPDVAILSFVMDDINGPQLAQLLCIRDPHLLPVLYSKHRELATEKYVANAFRYLVPPYSFELIAECMDYIRRELENRETSLLSFTDLTGHIFSLFDEEIYYLEVIDHVVNIYVSKTMFTARSTLDTLYAQLPHTFLRIHRGIIINTRYIRMYQYENVLIGWNGKEISLPIGSSRQKEVHAFMKARPLHPQMK